MDLGPSGRISNGDHTADRGAQMGSSKMSPHVFLLGLCVYGQLIRVLCVE